MEPRGSAVSAALPPGWNVPGAAAALLRALNAVSQSIAEASVDRSDRPQYDMDIIFWNGILEIGTNVLPQISDLPSLREDPGLAR
jgi:hypothetical protein